MVLDIDVKGMLAVRDTFPEAITIFIHVGSLEELERRLRLRATETESALQRRLATAKAELAQMTEYRHHILNFDRDKAQSELIELLVNLSQS
jgi:guanylate kinase